VHRSGIPNQPNLMKETAVKEEMTFIKMLPVLGLAALLAGCASTGRDSVTPPPRSLGDESGAVDVTTEAAQEALVPEVLTLTDALALALRGNPELAAFSYEVRAAEARVLQAGVLPNPEIGVDIEEFDRAGEGFDSAETAVTLGQVFELGDKRRWRTRVAEAEGELAGWDFESKRLSVFTETARRFTEVIAAQERLALSRSAVELAEQTSHAVAERVKAGKEPPLQASKSEAELEMARLEATTAENALQVARRNLAALWGAERADFEDVQGSLDEPPQAIPSLDELRPHLAGNPDLARWEAELRLRRATLASETASRIPDLEGSVGYLQFEEDGTEAFAFGIGMPLPLFDRNQGNIAAATHALAKAEAERAASEVALSAELAAAHGALTVSHQRVAALRDKVVPAMEQAYQAAHEGYQQGKFGFLDMLDAQRGLFEAKGAFVDALSDHQAARIEIQRLTGTGMDERMNETMRE
jgi:cobalt-zinc-cadmium efflux system outer membrane protein